MINKTFGELFDDYKDKVRTQQRFNDLVSVAFQNVYDQKMEQDLDALEDDQRLKIEVKRLLQIDNPISYVHSDEIPFADSSLKIVVSGDKNSPAYKEQSAKLAAFRCKKCGQVMTQAVELNCGCVLCRKCLEENDVQN